jgi:hypothetical protein
MIPPRQILAVDVDGTLVVSGRANVGLIDWLRQRKSEGFELILWSARGRSHAEAAVMFCDCSGLFDTVIGKPGYIVDDVGWAWIRHTRVVSGADFLTWGGMSEQAKRPDRYQEL